MRRESLAAALAGLLVAIPASASADTNRGTVLSVDKERQEIYVDLGAERGVGAGAELELLHRVVVRDPVTKEKLEDSFPVGRMTVMRAGERVSVARAAESVHKRVRVGDQVELTSRPRSYSDPWLVKVKNSNGAAPSSAVAGQEARSGAPRAAAGRVAEVELIREVWQETLGRPPAARIELWRALLDRQPTLSYAAEVEQEIASLAEQDRLVRLVSEDRATTNPVPRLAERVAALTPGTRKDGPLLANPPAIASDGERLDLAFAVRDPDAAASGWLYVRGPGDERFRRIALQRNGDAYLRATVPAELVKTPRLEYFVELSAPGEEEEPAVLYGSSEAPSSIQVSRSGAEPEAVLVDRSRVTLLAEYVDFDGGLAGGFDQYYQVEADFMYRFHRPVYSFRIGFGSLSGIGGPKDVIDEDPTDGCRQGGVYLCRDLTYSYIYAETEHRFSDVVALMIRPQAGRLTTDLREDAGGDRCLEGDPDDCEIDSRLGLRLRLRLGNETGTNLALGVGVTQRVGTLLEAAYSSSAAPRVPIRFAVQVTDMPVQEDFGVRLVGDIGYRALDWLYPSVRLSYQARDVDHAGFSGGAGINFDW